MTLTIGSLFAGVGGLEHGLEMSGLGPTIWQVEKDPNCRRVLAKHWPDAKRYEDVCEVGSLPRVDLICGGFPCQDVASPGTRKGLGGKRSSLWRQFARIIGECQPEWVVVENVTSGAAKWVDAVVCDLAECGYEALPIPLSAQGVGAPHVRRRVFIVAYAHREQLRIEPRRRRRPRRKNSLLAPKDGPDGPFAGWSQGAPVPSVCRVDDGIHEQLDRTRLRQLGNSVVPQCAEVVGYVIQELAA